MAEDEEDDPDGARLFAEIVAEAGRNARIAAIFRGVDDDVRALLLTALEMLAPGDAVAERRAVLADMIGTMALGMLHQQLIRRDFDGAPLARSFAVSVDREIDAMRADGAAAQASDDVRDAPRNASGSIP